MVTFKPTFCKLFNKYLNESKMSDARLAWKIGVNRSTVVDWRKGEIKHLSSEGLQAIANLLRLTTEQQDELMWIAGYSSPPPEQPPYLPMVGKPTLYPHQFFGQQRLLQKIAQVWRSNQVENLAIIGSRAFGKTSLLHYLESIATATFLRPSQSKSWHSQPMQFAIISFHDPSMYYLEVLVQELLTQLNLSSTCAINNLSSLLAHLNRLEQPSLILIDEISTGLRLPISHKFWYGIRTLRETNPNIGFLFTSHEPLEHLAVHNNHVSSWLNSFQQLEMEPFTEAEVLEYLSYFPAKLSAADATWIIEHSQRWPAALQILCQERLFALYHNYPERLWKKKALREINRTTSWLSTLLDNKPLSSPRVLPTRFSSTSRRNFSSSPISVVE